VTIDDAGVPLTVPAIILNGYQPEVRNCTFMMPRSAVAVIQLAGGMNAKIHDNRVIGSATLPRVASCVSPRTTTGLRCTTTPRT
jgi:hypothetical protein